MMHFAFSEEQQSFALSLKKVLHRECTPERVRAAWESDSGRIPGLWSTLAELGVVGLTVPTQYGGLGLAELDLVLLMEECGRAALPEPLLETTAVAVPLLLAVDSGPKSPRTVDKWGAVLKRVAAGESILAVGLVDAAYVSYAEHAELLLLQRGDALHAVPRERVQCTAQSSVDGCRRLFHVKWEPAADTLLCSGAEAKQAVRAAHDRGALFAAAELLGIARQLIDMTVTYVKVREQFGQPVGSFQAVKHHLANALLQLEFAAPTVYRAAYSLARGDAHSAVHASMAKAYASDAAALAGRVALQCHGAIGYSYEHNLHLWLKRGWALAAAWGDAAHHRERLGRILLSGESTTQRF